MGEIIRDLREKVDRLQAKKQQIQNFDMDQLNAQIQKIKDCIDAIKNAGIEVE